MPTSSSTRTRSKAHRLHRVLLTAAALTAGLALLAAMGCCATQRLLLPLAERTFSHGLFRVQGLEERIVVLTIDDGLSSRTGEVLDLLARYDALATFFVLTDTLPHYPGLVERALDAGHELGHHMPDATPSRQLSPADFASAFARADAALRAAGADPRFFRAGGGLYNADTMLPVLQAHAYTPVFVMASFLPWDTHLHWPETYADCLASAAFPGAILVLHDGEQEGPARLERTLITLERLLKALKDDGWRVTTLGEALERQTAVADAR